MCYNKRETKQPPKKRELCKTLSIHVRILYSLLLYFVRLTRTIETMKEWARETGLCIACTSKQSFSVNVWNSCMCVCARGVFQRKYLLKIANQQLVKPYACKYSKSQESIRPRSSTLCVCVCVCTLTKRNMMYLFDVVEFKLRAIVLCFPVLWSIE